MEMDIKIPVELLTAQVRKLASALNEERAEKWRLVRTLEEAKTQLEYERHQSGVLQHIVEIRNTELYIAADELGCPHVRKARDLFNERMNAILQ
ncbi:MAG TPA: hypothetical protein VJC20_01245 [Candidatus Paceibacterota bacterium]